MFFNFEFNGNSNSQKALLITLSSFLGILRGFLIVISILIGIIFYNGLVDKKFEINFFDKLNIYSKIASSIDNKTVDKIKNGLFEDNSLKTIIYYNGVTLDEGIESNNSIDSKAIKITKGLKTDREKAKELYKWIGSNIKYDFEKAENIQNSSLNSSGAIVACKAYNGHEYINHAWNQVYLSNEGKWINVDPTFYSAGNYFDNKYFNNDHKSKSIAGEW